MKNSRKPLIIVSMALLLAVVLAMSCVTFARYVRDTGTKSNSAKVATWGWNIAANADNLFGKAYDGTGLATVNAAGTGVVVAGTAQKNLVAPGTTGSMTFSISGQSEVKTQLDVTMTDSKTVIGDNDYEPIQWTLTKDGAAVTLDDTKFATVKAYIEGLTETIPANTDATGAGSYVLTWSWPLGDSTSANDATNMADTALGIAGNAEIVFNLGIKVTQIQ